MVKLLGTLILTASGLYAETASDSDRIAALEKEVAALKGEKRELAVITDAAKDKLTLGGYGEIHANFTDGGDSQLDIHRLVLYMGYEFADWIQLHSEVELEHASTDEEYLLIEQLYVDFLLSDAFNIRAGRVLAPLGIINQKHEPVLFNGVERPNVEKYIIPSTWMLDGVGIFGYPLGWLSYEVYAAAGLDNSGFSGKQGVRGGRMKGRPGLDDPAVAGRVDFYPVTTENQDLRIGLSGYFGGTNNKNKGGDSASGIDNTFAMASADFEYNLSRLRLRGVMAHGTNSDADRLNAATGGDVGEQIFGWYLEAGVDVMPESWQKGKLKESALIPFVRYEEYNTHFKTPVGTPENAAYDRAETTVGVSWLLTPQFVIKADAQFLSNEKQGSGVNNIYNLGIGWVL